MPLVIVFMLIFSLFVLGVGVKSIFSKTDDENVVTSQKISNSSRGEIEKMLKRIEIEKVPASASGRTCYMPSLSGEYQEYVCPIHGEKTVLNKVNGNDFVSNIVEIRRSVDRLNSITNLARFRLDEKKLCRICSPNIGEEQRHITLITRYPDGKEHVYEGVSLDDLQVLEAFFKSGVFYVAGPGENLGDEGETKAEVVSPPPLGLEADSMLKEGVSKIEEILGINEENLLKENNDR